MAQWSSIDAVSPEIRRELRNKDNELRILQDRVNNSASLSGGLPFIGSFDVAPAVPTYPAVYRLRYTSGSADFGDEYWISGKAKNGKWKWERLHRFGSS